MHLDQEATWEHLLPNFGLQGSMCFSNKLFPFSAKMSMNSNLAVQCGPHMAANLRQNKSFLHGSFITSGKQASTKLLSNAQELSKAITAGTWNVVHSMRMPGQEGESHSFSVAPTWFEFPRSHFLNNQIVNSPGCHLGVGTLRLDKTISDASALA